MRPMCVGRPFPGERCTRTAGHRGRCVDWYVDGHVYRALRARLATLGLRAVRRTRDGERAY